MAEGLVPGPMAEPSSQTCEDGCLGRSALPGQAGVSSQHSQMPWGGGGVRAGQGSRLGPGLHAGVADSLCPDPSCGLLEPGALWPATPIIV